MAAFEWDCDCGWEWDLDSTEWSSAAAAASSQPRRPTPPPPPPPFFDLPPPPLPPSLQPPPELCSTSDHPLGLETCQAFLVSDAERQVPVDTSSSAAVIFIPAVVLTIAFFIIGFVAWRFRKQKLNQKALLRCHQPKTMNGPGGGVLDGVPAILQGLNGRQVAGVNDDEDVFYDELISYPPQFRAPNHPPAYEMKDVLLESTSPCHCTAHPLLGNSGTHRSGGSRMQPHYVTSPYRCASHSPPSSTPTIDDQHDSSWITEPVYEELPSGPEEDGRFSRDHRARHRNGSVNDSLRSQRGGSADQRPSNYSNNSNWSGEEPGETDFFLPPSTWYHQQTQQHSSPILRGQMTTQGPVRQGRGGIRAAWREMEPSLVQTQPSRTASSASQPNSGRRKRKVKSIKNNAGGLETLNNQSLHYHCTGLYRGKCPPEEPPFLMSGENDPPAIIGPLEADSPAPSEQLSTPTKTQPRYYYYSESDDYGVMNQPRTLSSSRRGQQRHLSRVHRTLQARSPTSSDNKNVA